MNNNSQDNNKKEQKRLNDVVKSKIKGLGLDALFHQVDISQKDKPDYPTKQKAAQPQELQIIEKIQKGISHLPLLHLDQAKSIFNRLVDSLEKLITKKTEDKIIIDIGTSNIKMIYLTYDKEKIILQDIMIIPIPYIVTTTKDKLKNFIHENEKLLKKKYFQDMY